MDGAGSFLEASDATGSLTMRGGDTTILSVSGGARARFTEIDLGATLLIEGPGSKVEMFGGGGTRNVDLPNDPQQQAVGTLEITGGGELRSFGTTLRSGTAASPGAFVSGEGSLWDSRFGFLLVEGGHLQVTNLGRVIADGLSVEAPGIVSGHLGTIQLLQPASVENGAFVNAGLLRVGNSPGLLTIDGDYVQQPGGTLEIEIGGFVSGENHDLLVVTGDASLGGELRVKFIDGFAPMEGDEFVFLDVQGAAALGFSDVIIENLEPGFASELAMTDGFLALRALSDGVFSPDVDGDADGVPDVVDNCVLVPNTDQADIDAGQDDDASRAGSQSYGDACDLDFDNDGIVGASDFFGGFRGCLGTDPAADPICQVADCNDDGVVGAGDFFTCFRPAFGSAPGPGATQ